MGMSDTSINQFNLKIRTSPWYQEWFQAKGLDPNKVQLTKDQRNELKAIVEQNTGFKFPGDMKIDPAGNLNEKGGWAGLPTGVKVALIAAAAVGTAGAAGALGGGAAGVGAGGTGSGVAAAAGAPTAASTGMGLGALGTTAGVGSTLGTIGTVANAVKSGGSTMDKIGNILRGGAGAVGAATEAAAQRQAQEDDSLYRAQQSNMQGENAFQSQQLAQAREEAAQRDEARKNLYRASIMKNPQFSVENPRGAQTFSPEMMEGLTNLEKQALSRTADTPQYTSAKMRAPQFAPLDPQALSQTSRPGTMETIGNWLAPGLSLTDLLTDTF